MPRYSPRTGQLQTYQVGPYSALHLYMQFGGKLPGEEQWSCGMRFINKGAGSSGDESTMLVGAAAAVSEWWSAPASGMSTSATLQFVKLNTIGTNGKYVGSGTTEATWVDKPGGANGASQLPNQVALVATLLTGFNRGPAHKGRFYLPIPYTNTGVDGRIPATGNASADSFQNALTTLLTNLNAVSANWEIGVMSRKAGAPGARRVTGISVGRVLDTQRRRRRSLVEDYQS